MSAEVFVVTSGKGGAGKSTAVVNIGATFAALGKRVLLIDANVGFRNLDLLLGLESDGVFHLLDVANGNCACSEAVISDRRFTCLDVLLAPQIAEESDLSSKQMTSVCASAKENYDYIFLDAPAGTGKDFCNVVSVAERAIVLTTPDMLSVRNTDRIIAVLEKQGIENQQLVVNRVRTDLIKNGDQQRIEFVMDTLGIPLLGIVPEEDAVIASASGGEPLVLRRKSRAGVAFSNIAHRLMGEHTPLLELEKGSLFHKKH